MVGIQGLDYKEIVDYLNSKITLEEAIYITKRDTRHFAKRQITCKRKKDVVWVNKPEFWYEDEKILDYMIEQLNIKEIL